jgi:hypothetical protein
MEGTLMEHSVTIAIPKTSEEFVMPIFDTLVDQYPDARTVMDVALAEGRTYYVLGVDADDAHDASAAAVRMFRDSFGRHYTLDEPGTRIVDLHAQIASGDELSESALQTL